MPACQGVRSDRASMHAIRFCPFMGRLAHHCSALGLGPIDNDVVSFPPKFIQEESFPICTRLLPLSALDYSPYLISNLSYRPHYALNKNRFFKYFIFSDCKPHKSDEGRYGIGRLFSHSAAQALPNSKLEAPWPPLTALHRVGGESGASRSSFLSH
jgi:hypothetical protein